MPVPSQKNLDATHKNFWALRLRGTYCTLVEFQQEYGCIDQEEHYRMLDNIDELLIGLGFESETARRLNR